MEIANYNSERLIPCRLLQADVKQNYSQDQIIKGFLKQGNREFWFLLCMDTTVDVGSIKFSEGKQS